MEEKAADEMEVAAQEDEERAQAEKAAQNRIKVIFLNCEAIPHSFRRKLFLVKLFDCKKVGG